MKKINEAVSPVTRPEKIMQYGEGGFLRAFVDWMIDILNEKSGFNGNVVIVQPLERGMGDVLNSQEGLYTTVLRGVQKGQTTEEIRTIRSVSRCINPYSAHEEYMRCAENPDLRFVISNTTEAGIAYSPDDKPEDKPQKSYPGKVTAFLYRRFTHFAGDTAKALVFIPCELIDKNGDKLKEIVLRYATEWNLGDDFLKWLAACDFCNSLVDRIVTGYPKDEAAALCEKIGCEDQLLDTAEIFHLWVIETKRDYSEELPFGKAGLNVIWTDDMSFYRTRKVRILNGAHTSSVLAAFQYGLNTVEECTKDKLVHAFMHKVIFDEIIPSMNGSTEELTQYANDVLERFANPYIKHLLLSISLNSVSKFKTRVLPSITGYIAKQGKIPPALSFSLAALFSFYKGKDFASGSLTGRRGTETYAITDDEPVLKEFEALYAAHDAATEAGAAAVVQGVLKKADWWGEDLTAIKGFAEAVSGALLLIQSKGMKAALEEVTK
ncbi:altronate oxidoreductase [Spirochaetia bacterium]|nr:altronate oxidoreductase [Spirochaetia bacterium]